MRGTDRRKRERERERLKREEKTVTFWALMRAQCKRLLSSVLLIAQSFEPKPKESGKIAIGLLISLSLSLSLSSLSLSLSLTHSLCSLAIATVESSCITG
jgi:hypothetical protein